MEKKKEEDVRKKTIMELHQCPECKPLPLIFYERESNRKELIFRCSLCKLKAVAVISGKRIKKWLYIKKSQVLLDSFIY